MKTKGSFFSSGKNEYLWRFLASLSPEIYLNDKSVVPYTPDCLQVYSSFFPDQYTVFPLTELSVVINDKLVATGKLQDPTGFFWTYVPVPKGNFKLEVKTASGTVLATEFYNSKNYATFFDVAAQSYGERRTAIEQVTNDVDFQTMRSERVPAILGGFFDFMPPAGWTSDEYRNAILGGCGPGFVSSFFDGATRKGTLDTVKSITCQDAELLPLENGDRWVIFDHSHAPSPTDATSADAWFVSDAAIPAPNHRALLFDSYYAAYGVVLKVNGSSKTVTDEVVAKRSNSFIESRLPGPYVLAGKSLTFSIEVPDQIETKQTYVTTFVAATDAASAAAEILFQNPTLTSAVYDNLGKLRIGTEPEAGTVKRVTIVAGGSLADFGFTAGDSVDVIPDILANPWATGVLVLNWDGYAYTQGVDFSYAPETGEIVWEPSSPVFSNVPPVGASMTTTYTYEMRREIGSMVDKVKDTTIILEYEWA